ncbi:MAG: hypothetical protein D6714_10030 [Bacteroidetes bacterium]|nr:MAG: hypothetical protein D6714_10030 [Bacteroidota bacterium]
MGFFKTPGKVLDRIVFTGFSFIKDQSFDTMLFNNRGFSRRLYPNRNDLGIFLAQTRNLA